MSSTIGKNFCIAPFTQMTFGPSGGYSPCPEIGGRPWKNSQVNVIEMWNSNEFNLLRQSFKSNQKDPICDRCWQQESHGKDSLRQRLISKKKSGSMTFQPGELLPFIESGYQQGPRQINIMVGNMCNLRCRICTATSSVTYNIEGNYYKEKYGVESKRYIGKSKRPISFDQENIDQIFLLGKNLRRIEFYGGEPLLDEPTLALLAKFVDSGQSSNITLFYNTNGTVRPKARHFELWNRFKSLEFNFSIDDIDHRFTYARHPAQWSDFVSNIQHIRSHDWLIPVQCTSICTVSNLNIYYLPEILERLNDMDLPCFVNNLNSPAYYEPGYLPNKIKEIIMEKLQTSDQANRIKFLISMLQQPENLQHWNDFKFWTHAKDEYRQENFSATYPEFYKILLAYDKTF